MTCLLTAACGRSELTVAPPAGASVSGLALYHAVSAPAQRQQRFDAVLEAVEQSTVAAQTTGRVIDLPVDVNDTVKAGDVLARIGDAASRAQLAAAQAALHEAQSEYERVKSVYDQKLIARAQMDRATSARDQAQAALDAALDQDSHAVVHAPFAGIVTARPIQTGELAAPGRPIVTLLSLDRQRAVVDVPQQFVGALRNGNGVRVELPDGATVDATAVHFFPYADEHTHTFRARVELPALGGHGVYPGQLVKVEFPIPGPPVVAVPAAAIAHRGELTGLYVAGDHDRLEFRAVRAGETLSDGRIEILAGLSSGESVAEDPLAAAIALRRAEGGAS